MSQTPADLSCLILPVSWFCPVMVLPGHPLQVTVEQHEQLETDGGEEGGEEEKIESEQTEVHWWRRSGVLTESDPLCLLSAPTPETLQNHRSFYRTCD